MTEQTIPAIRHEHCCGFLAEVNDWLRDGRYNDSPNAVAEALSVRFADWQLEQTEWQNELAEVRARYRDQVESFRVTLAEFPGVDLPPLESETVSILEGAADILKKSIVSRREVPLGWQPSEYQNLTLFPDRPIRSVVDLLLVAGVASVLDTWKLHRSTRETPQHDLREHALIFLRNARIALREFDRSHPSIAEIGDCPDNLDSDIVLGKLERLVERLSGLLVQPLASNTVASVVEGGKSELPISKKELARVWRIKDQSLSIPEIAAKVRLSKNTLYADEEFVKFFHGVANRDSVRRGSKLDGTTDSSAEDESFPDE